MSPHFSRYIHTELFQIPDLPGDGQPDDPRLFRGLQVQGRRQQVHEQLPTQEARHTAPRPEEGVEEG